MIYELSESLTRILRYSKVEADRLNHTSVDASCLMLGLLHDENSRVAEVLRTANVSLPDLKKTFEQSAEQESQQQGQDIRTSTNAEFRLNTDSRRILRLALLEARLSGAGKADEQHLLLAFLRDRDNNCRKILNNMDVNYTRVASAFNLKPGVKATFGFADDEPGDFHQQNETPQNANAKQKDAPSSETPITDNFGTDLTKKAADGLLDPIVGREKEIERIAQILCRRKKNNPILIGGPGVGKSAVVEGLATLIVKHKVPRLLQGKRIVALDMAAIVAGTQYRGQFEERLRRLMKELSEHKEIVLFIDEIHTIIGAGSTPGTLDAANILKPALARGEVQCIGATTTDEYRKSIEKDGALERRFQKIQLEPTTAEETLQILQNIKGRYEDHHNVTYTDDALEACVQLTTRYISDRCLPDKAIDALDEAGSRQHLTGLSAPKEIEDMEKRIADLKQQKMKAVKAQNYERAAQLRDESTQLSQQLEVMSNEWLSRQKTERQQVDAEQVANVVSMMSGVPVQRMAADETARLKGMRKELSSKVIAQDEAITKLVRAITRNRLGLKGADRPVGSFLFVGPTGVGKTYLVKCLAEYMFGSKDSLIRIDMSEYGEKYSISRLVGAPPGYVGYEEGGQLTEKVRRHPYSVILLDEIEKAHPDVFNTLLQVMDEGRMTDGNGVTVDFRNTIIIMTSNSGTRQLKDFGQGIGFSTAGGNNMSAQVAEGIVRKALQKQFAPEFLNRLDDIIMFQPLTNEDAVQIADLELNKLIARLTAMHLNLELTPAAKDFVVKQGFNAQYGARSLKRSIQTHIEDAVCDLIMDADNQPEGEERTIRFNIENGKLKAVFA